MRMESLPPPGGGELSRPARARLAALLVHGGSVAAGAEARALAGAGWIGPEGRLEPGRAVLMGTDVGGTKAQSVLCDLEGRVLAETKAPTAGDSAPALVAQIVTQQAELLEQAGRSEGDLVALGVGVPAAFEPVSRRLHRAPNLPALEDSSLPELIAARCAGPLVLENDVNMAALGESWRGGSGESGGDSLVFIALGTGVGMGTVVRGELLRGANGAAGEIAYLPIGADPFDPGTRRTGALESVISSRALLDKYRRNGGTIDGSLRELFAHPHDPAFAAVLDHLARLLAQAVTAVAAVLDPGQIVLGGSVGSRPELLARLELHLSDCMAEPPVCRISALGNRAGAIGAARAGCLELARSLA